MISVVMTTYNGAAYLKAQLDSVLGQLDDGDEVVASDDGSTDGTWEALQRRAQADPRLRPLQGPGRGVVANMEHALRAARGDLLFLSDQDDVWLPEKVARVCAEMDRTGADVLLHDACICDGDLRVTHPSFFAWRGCRRGFWYNVLKNSYIGCCMAVRAGFLPKVLPFPSGIPMHDQWIGLMAERYGRVTFLGEALLMFRRHGSNTSSTQHSGVVRMLRWRVSLLRALLRRKGEHR